MSDPLGSTTPERMAEADVDRGGRAGLGGGRLVGHRDRRGDRAGQEHDGGDQRSLEHTTQAVDLSSVPLTRERTQGFINALDRRFLRLVDLQQQRIEVVDQGHEGIDDGGIEVLPALAAQLVEGVLHGPGLLVGPR